MNTIFKHYQNFIDFKSIGICKSTLRNYYTVSKNLRFFLKQNNEFKKIENLNSIRFMRTFNTYLYSRFGKYHVKRHITTIQLFIVYLVNDEILEFSKVRNYSPVLPKQ